MRWALFALLFGIADNCIIAQEGTAPKTKSDETISRSDESKAWHARRLAEFAAYDVVQISPEGEVPLKFEKTSLLNWSNPIRDTPAGAVFVWTIEGRPQLIASVYPYKDGVEQEMSSLSEHPLLLNQGKSHQHRFTLGVEWREMPIDERPHKQRTLRLVQMRRIAERVRVTCIGNNTFDARLLTQPIYRNSVDSKVDSAIFAFVQGTDPEAVLLIEALETNTFRVALGRMTAVRITADLDNERIWDLPWFTSSFQNDQPFHKIQYPGQK